MMKTDLIELALMNVTVSYLVQARSKSHALKMARFQLNDETISLDGIQLEHRSGLARWMKVEHVESIHWAAAEASEFSSQFKVIGHIRLALRVDAHGDSVDSVLQGHYQFPRSVLQDKTVWVIPTLHEPAFTQVLSQTLEGTMTTGDSAALTRAV